MKVQIIVGATREGRISSKVAQWVAKEAQNLDGVETEVLELTDYPMPFFDEVAPPQYNPSRTPVPAVQKWLDKLAEAEAYVIVTPEYNRSFTGVLKNALDHIDFQVTKKPIAIVAHGSTGGAQAVASLRITLPGYRAITVPSATFFVGRAGEMLDDSGELTDEQAKSNPYGVQGSLKATLAELKWYGDALSAARSTDQ